MSDPTPEHVPEVRGTNGRFIRTIEGAERDAKAADLRSQGMKYRDIADVLGIDVSNAHAAVKRALKAIVQEPAADVLALELDRLDGELTRLNGLEESVREVLEKQHFTVSHGKVIYMGDEPLLDDGPVLAAVDRLLRIDEQRRRNGESRRKLLGLDAPTKTQISGGVSYEIVGVDMDQLK